MGEGAVGGKERPKGLPGLRIAGLGSLIDLRVGFRTC